MRIETTLTFEILDLQLIKKIAKTKKPIIISTGTASLEEIKLAYNQAKKFGSKDITLLYCVSNYPSSIKDFNIYNIKILKSCKNKEEFYFESENFPEVSHDDIIDALSGAFNYLAFKRVDEFTDDFIPNDISNNNFINEW